jgi:DNA-directed RNA polymerase specialized sigma24 family protein
MGTSERAELDDERESTQRLQHAARGDRAAWSAVLAQHRDRLRRMVALRLDRRLHGRVDPSDVIKDAYLEAARRLPEYLREPAPMPPFLWLRYITSQALQTAHRRHLGAQARDAGREISIDGGRYPQATSAALAAQLLGHDTRASEAAIRAERRLRLERCIGEGGMGAVYEAIRESLHNRVALKVIHPRFRASAGYLRRFQTEARSAAQLHHTNIVSVFDYGQHDGVCYYAMQYIDGHSLDEILVDVRRLRSNQGPVKAAPVGTAPAANTTGAPASDGTDHGATGTEAAPDPLLRTVTQGLLTGQFTLAAGEDLDTNGTPPPNTEPIAPAVGAPTAAAHDLAFHLVRPQATSSPPARDRDRRALESAVGLSSSSLAGQGEDRYHREVARLGAQVADALAHAHKRGVLHRDIKPSNLLLDAVGNVWVTDFGLAKFEEGEDLSRSQDVVGTLGYMAPERFRGVSDRRCDLYALGATLYELLTLRPAFESHDRLRLIDQIVNEPPRALAAARPPYPPRPGDHRAQGAGQGTEGLVRHRRRAGGRAAAVPGEPANPLAPHSGV